MTTLRFVTWNLNYRTAPRTDLKARLLRTREWDVAALQEVGRGTFERLRQDGLGDDALFTLGPRSAGETGKDKQMGVVLLGRNGWQLTEASEALAGLPLRERGLVAKAERDGECVWVCSWHSPNAVARDPEVRARKIADKMTACRTLAAWLGGRPGPAVVGMDANGPWEDTLDPEPSDIAGVAEWERREDGFDPEHAFVGSRELMGPRRIHDLRDAWQVYLRNHAEIRERTLELRPDGPLAVSYNRGVAGSTKGCRYDHIYASPEFEVESMSYVYDDAIGAGSDHALVQAELRLPRQ